MALHSGKKQAEWIELGTVSRRSVFVRQNRVNLLITMKRMESETRFETQSKHSFARSRHGNEQRLLSCLVVREPIC